MANSQHCSDYSDTEDCISDRTSNLSLSIGYFPCEHSFYSDTPSYADSSSVDSSVHLLPPIQGTWQTESTRRRVLRRDQVKDSPEQFCKLSIALAWDIDVDSDCEDTRTNWARSGDQQWTDKYPAESTKRTLSKLGDLMQKLETFLENKKNDEENDSVSPASTEEEDSRLSSTSPPHLAQVGPQERDTGRDSLRLRSPEDVIQSPDIPRRLKEDESAEMSVQIFPGRRRDGPGADRCTAWGLLTYCAARLVPCAPDMASSGRETTARQGARVQLEGK